MKDKWRFILQRKKATFSAYFANNRATFRQVFASSFDSVLLWIKNLHLLFPQAPNIVLSFTFSVYLQTLFWIFPLLKLITITLIPFLEINTCPILTQYASILHLSTYAPWSHFPSALSGPISYCSISKSSSSSSWSHWIAQHRNWAFGLPCLSTFLPIYTIPFAWMRTLHALLLNYLPIFLLNVEIVSDSINSSAGAFQISTTFKHSVQILFKNPSSHLKPIPTCFWYPYHH